MPSFDVTSQVDLQEVDNAVNQARKEIAQRYDFKGSKAAIDFDRTEGTLTLTADDEFKMQALWEVLETRMIRRKVPVKNMKRGDIERGANDTVRRVVTLQQGIPTEAARENRQVPEGQEAPQGAARHPGRPASDHVAVPRRTAIGDGHAARRGLRRRTAVRELPGVACKADYRGGPRGVTMPERRKLKRRHLLYYLQVFKGPDNSLAGHVVDITPEGVMLMTGTEMAPGRTLELRMIMPGDPGDDRELQFTATSLWCRQDVNPDFWDVGFKTEGLSRKQAAAIETLIDDYGFRD